MTQLSTLQKSLYQQFGLSLKRFSQHAPFKLIKCPLCLHADFICYEFAAVHCGHCHATFTLQSGVSPPELDAYNFIFTCFWHTYHPHHTLYLLPQTTSVDLFLRPLNGFTHWQLQGYPPTPGTLFHPHLPRFNFDGYPWPQSAMLRTGLPPHLPWHTDPWLEQTLAKLKRLADGDADLLLAAHLLAFLHRPHPPLVASPLPNPKHLLPGQQYLLHHWTLDENTHFVNPVWWIVNVDLGPPASKSTISIIQKNIIYKESDNEY